MKDKKAVIFYFLMTLILLDFGNHLKNILKNPNVTNAINNDVFSIHFINNTGSAFNLFQDKTIFLAILGIIVIIFVAIEIFKNITFNDKTQLLALTLFSAGALGNVIERFRFGYVADYIKLNFIKFPVFNAFDIMICTGIFLYCLYLFLDFKNNKKAENDKN